MTTKIRYLVIAEPDRREVWLLGGGSGHGFKLAPAVGELAAGAILSGKYLPPQFRLARLGKIEKRKTQFESKD